MDKKLEENRYSLDKIDQEALSDLLSDLLSEDEASDSDQEIYPTTSKDDRLSDSDINDSTESDGEKDEVGDKSIIVNSTLPILAPQSLQGPAAEHTDWTDDPPCLKYIPFQANPGLKVPMIASEPADFFNLLFDASLFNMIVNETNKMATTMFLNGVAEHSRITTWYDVTPDEMKKFFGILFMMGIIKINRIEDYWKRNRFFNLPIFKNMSSHRFLLILRVFCFHVDSEDEKINKNDRFRKITPLVNYFNKKMNEVYCPKKELSLNESMVLWQGRLIFSHYTKNINKYGIKLYFLTETNSVVLKVLVNAASADTEVGHADNVVFKLMENYLHSGYSLYMDNFYNSVHLAQNLLEKDTYVTGTLNPKKKGNPREVVLAQLRKGEKISRNICKINLTQGNTDTVVVTKWKDWRDVLIISTEHSSDLRAGSTKRDKITYKPSCVIECNKYMSSVDHFDKMLSYYTCERKTLRWYKKLGIHLIQVLLFNSYILYSKSALILQNKKIDYQEFILSIVDQLLPEIPSTPPLPLKILGLLDHMPKEIQATTKDGRNKRWRCRYCSQQKIQKKTKFFCPVCPDKPGLCADPCFHLYHKQLFT